MDSNGATTKIVDLLKQSPGAIETIQRVLNTFSSVNITKPEPGELFLTCEDQYMTLMLSALEYAIFPHAGRPALASLVAISSRESARQWVVCQIKTHVVNETWVHASHLGKLAQAFSKMFFAMGRCKFPMCLTRDKAEAWFDMWRIINETRMTRNNWTFLGENIDNIPPSLKLFRSIAEQNQQRIRSRYLRALTLEGNSGSMDDVPSAQGCEDDDVDEELPVAEPNVKLCLPTEIALCLYGPNPR